MHGKRQTTEWNEESNDSYCKKSGFDFFDENIRQPDSITPRFENVTAGWEIWRHITELFSTKNMWFLITLGT